MACFQIAGSGFSPAVTLRPGLLNRRFAAPAVFIRCRGEESDRGFGGEEAPESLFMKELKRRGMTPTSLLEEGKRGAYELGEKEMEEAIEEDVVSTGRKKKRNGVVLDAKGVVNQRKVSMALNSEGLEGLIPRAKLLLTLGGTFFLAFWPLILVTVATFAALYLYFGPSFVHNASKMLISPPPYVDPYALLEDERISQTAPKMS